MDVATERIRNVALVGHNGNGKTTLAEAMLFIAGVINRQGRVEDGNTVLDSDPEEHDRVQSLSLSVASLEWNGHKINLIDAPGYADFVADAYTALRTAELAVFVIDAVAGVQIMDELVWRKAAEWSVPRMIFINKMDRDRASFERTLTQVRERFGSGVEPVELPIGEESSFHGVADLLTEHAFLYDSDSVEETADLPPEIAQQEHAEHDQLVEDVVEIDDSLLEKYLEGTDPSVDELERALHEGIDRAHVFPVLCGSATGPIAVDRLLEFITHVGPAPGELGPVEVIAGDTLAEVDCDRAGKPLLYVFDTMTDDYVGQVSMFKVLSGIVSPDDVLVNPRTGDKHRLHNIAWVRGASLEPASKVVAGDIAAVTKLTGVFTGDTLAPEDMPVRVESPLRQEPVHGLAVAPTTPADDDKLAHALHRLVEEDPSLRVERNDETHQTILRGMGDVHLQVTLARIARRWRVEVATETVKVAYRETLAKKIEVEGKYKKQTGGHGQFGVAVVTFEPLERGAGYEFEDKVVGGAIPRALIPAVDKGIHEAMERGGLHGFPVVDLRAVCTDGKHHPVDSSEMSFKMAGSLAFREAFEQAGSVVLEPISAIEVSVPSSLQGEVLGDLNSRRGQVQRTEIGPGSDEVTVFAAVPTSEIVHYAIDLRSMTHGAGRFTARVDRYQEVPSQLVGRLTDGDD